MIWLIMNALLDTIAWRAFLSDIGSVCNSSCDPSSSIGWGKRMVRTSPKKFIGWILWANSACFFIPNNHSFLRLTALSFYSMSTSLGPIYRQILVQRHSVSLVTRHLLFPFTFWLVSASSLRSQFPLSRFAMQPATQKQSATSVIASAWWRSWCWACTSLPLQRYPTFLQGTHVLPAMQSYLDRWTLAWIQKFVCEMRSQWTLTGFRMGCFSRNLLIIIIIIIYIL